MSKNLNYNRDIVKHYVRYHGWRNSFRAIKNYVEREIRRNKRVERCKYLTFCAAQAIDVFMLESEGYIFRDPTTNRLTNVFFCENDEESFSLITKMIGNEVQGFFGDFEEIVLQDLDELVVNPSDPFDEPSSEKEREKIRLKEVKKSLLKSFPFDVINLDLYGNFFPGNQGRYSDACKTYNEVLELQKIENGHSCNRFLMFLTVYTPVLPNQINRESMNHLILTLNQNMGYERFRNGFMSRFNHISPNEIDFYLQFVIGFAKQVIFKESYRIGWQPTLKEVYCYDRMNEGKEEPYKMSTFVVEYRRNTALGISDFVGAIPNAVEEDYLNQLEDLVLNQPHIVPNVDQIDSVIMENLAQIVEFRNEFLKKIDVYDVNRFT